MSEQEQNPHDEVGQQSGESIAVPQSPNSSAQARRALTSRLRSISLPMRLLLLSLSMVLLLAMVAWRWPASRLVIGALGGTLVALLMLWLIPKWQVAHLTSLQPSDLFEQENEARKTLAQIVGGILVLAGLYYTNENIKISQRSAEDAQRSATESRELTRQGQLTDRFTKAVEQLGKEDSPGTNNNLPTRLGGIYALERIANESREDHWPIVELLLQYVYQTKAGKDGVVTPEVQAILTALGRRNSSYETPDQKIALTDLDLRFAQFTGNFDNSAFDRSRLQNARFSQVHLRGSSFTETNLTQTRFQNADLRGTVFNSTFFVGGSGIGRSTVAYTDFIDTDMTGVTGLECKDIASALFNEKTVLPESLNGCNITRTPFVEYLRGKPDESSHMPK